MPPKRAKKVGLTRMDAAVDALKPMGYTSHFVRRKVKQLLKVYGDEGWSFIEEAAYTLLIETILEDGDGECEEGEASTKNENKDLGTTKDEPSHAVLSCDAIEPLCSSQDPLLLSPITVLNPLLPLGEPIISPSKSGTMGEHDFYLAQGHPLNERKPSFGFIGHEAGEDYVLLKPAPVKGWGAWKTGEKRKKRKSRWDVGPDDIV